jgi:uncharacterized protein (TIGR03067 family)
MRAVGIMVLALSALTAARAEDVDPEPPGNSPLLRKLQGKWAVTRRVSSGPKVVKQSVITYEFVGDKVTVMNGKFKMLGKVKIHSKSKPMVLELIREDIKTTNRLAFKTDNGELYLVAVPRNGDVPADEDFSGKSRVVTVLGREKKKE